MVTTPQASLRREQSSTIPTHMRAAVYRGVNDVRVETVPVPEIGPGEVLIRVHTCGICGTDLKKIHTGSHSAPRIFVLRRSIYAKLLLQPAVSSDRVPPVDARDRIPKRDAGELRHSRRRQQRHAAAARVAHQKRRQLDAALAPAHLPRRSNRVYGPRVTPPPSAETGLA